MSTIVNYDRLFCYLWSEDDHECKFGQRWVAAGLDPQSDCERRVRDSLGVRKDIFPQIQARGVQIWDVSDHAKDIGQFDKKAKVDDYIRKHIGFRKNSTGEVHSIPQPIMSIHVCKYLSSQNQKLIDATLSTAQYEAASDVVDAYNNGKRTVLAELCARFGKTIWSSAVATETDMDVVIVASYVKTVFASFASDIVKFEQFKEYVHVDTSQSDYLAQIESARSSGKKVFAYLSLCQGSKRQDRINALFSLSGKRMLIIDEADFGAHRANQTIPLQSARKDDDFVLIMTGTRPERAVSYWDIDYATATTYFELLVQKKEAA